METTYQGSCHCGRVRFSARTDLQMVTDCNCSMCNRKGFLHVIVARDAFELLSGGDALTTYQFNTGIAKHTFCRFCGVHPFYTPRSHPDKIDVNVRCLEGVDWGGLRIEPFDGRNWEASVDSWRAKL